MNIPKWQVDGTLAKAEREAIIAALVLFGWRPSAMAVQLNVGRSTLYRLFEKYEIDKKDVIELLKAARPLLAEPIKRIGAAPPSFSTPTRRKAASRPMKKKDPVSNQSSVVIKDGNWLLVSMDAKGHL